MSGYLQDCNPIFTNRDAEVTHAVDGTPLDPNAPAYPCGLVAKSLFNDTFALYRDDTSVETVNSENFRISIDDTDIAWDLDKKYNFANMLENPNWASVQWHDVTDQHFIVWMRISAFPNFRKLYGQVHEGLKKGKYKLRIENNYGVEQFVGHKYFVITTMNFLGGKNYFLGICYIVVGVFCIVGGVIFLIAYYSKNGFSIQKREDRRD